MSLQKGGQHFRTLAANPTGSAVTPENAWVTSLSIGKNDLDLDGALPGGITVGMSRSALEALFDRKGIPGRRCFPFPADLFAPPCDKAAIGFALPAVFQVKDCQLRPVSQIQFFQNLRQIVPYCSFRQEQSVSDFSVGITLGNKLNQGIFPVRDSS